MTGWLKTDLEDFTDLLNDSELKEEPVPLEEFYHGKHYLNFKEPLGDKQAQLIKMMSQIYYPNTLIDLYGEAEAERIWREDTKMEIVAMLGKGSGKDFSSRIAFCYTTYKLHCLTDVLGYYNKAPGTYIDLLNIAINADQARQVFFEPLKNIMRRSEWFESVGVEERKSTLEFQSAPIRLFSGNSEAESWEGLDLFLCVLDEIAAFKTEQAFKSTDNSQRLSAKAIYDMAEASITSRFPDIGKLILLSFPRYRNDFIMQRYADAANYPDKVFRMKAAPWEVNPTKKRSDYDHYYNKNPIEARARFECEPPEMVDSFFRDPSMVRQCFEARVTLDANGIEVYKEVPQLFPIDEQGRFKPWFKDTSGHTRYIHTDLAKGTRDRAAVCMVHVAGYRDIETEPGSWEKLPVIKMDSMKWWTADPGKEIQFDEIRKHITDLCKKFPVGQVSFDQWQSVDMIQTLRNRGIRAERQPVNVNAYDTLATCFYDGRFSGYFIDILVEQELLKLQLLPNGKVDHPSDTTKDLADALAGAVFSACLNSATDQEIDIDIIGGDEDEDWESAELEDALEDDKHGRITRSYETKIEEIDDDWNFESV
jgi:hypothetical protein